MQERGILAVDLGVKTGMAWFSRAPALLWYGSRNFGNAQRLKRAIPGILSHWPETDYLVMEGGGALATLWEKAAMDRGIKVIQITAEDWRRDLLIHREQRSGLQAKQVAIQRAVEVIRQLHGPMPLTPLQDDTAEAILAGWWAVRRLGWTDL
ncbi:MAG: hypothetical protein IH599_07505 [Bacteroidales bacterium]|nr:hypothetical protein [Bacteroidales bacterium]